MALMSSASEREWEPQGTDTVLHAHSPFGWRKNPTKDALNSVPFGTDTFFPLTIFRHFNKAPFLVFRETQ